MQKGPPLTIRPEEHAFFLDLDGTLLELAPRPEGVKADAALLALLNLITTRCAGALALVTGRRIEALDQITFPYRFPASGVHGFERRDAAGVKVALGTDAAVYPHGLNAHEVEVYVTKLGMTPLAALQTGTINAADLMGWSDRTGALEAGKWADVIAVEGDPLADVRTLQNVRFVMKAGIVYKQ